MKSKITLDFEDYSSIELLPIHIQSLFSKAFEARNNAYAPYSEFKVGTAILLENDVIILGNNQENASYPVGTCAERVAINYAHANFPKQKIKTIAIVAGKDMGNNNPIAPCGMCRQALLEYEHKQNLPITIYFMGTTGKIIKFNSIKDLLPFSFSQNSLM